MWAGGWVKAARCEWLQPTGEASANGARPSGQRPGEIPPLPEAQQEIKFTSSPSRLPLIRPANATPSPVRAPANADKLILQIPASLEARVSRVRGRESWDDRATRQVVSTAPGTRTHSARAQSHYPKSIAPYQAPLLYLPPSLGCPSARPSFYSNKQWLGCDRPHQRRLGAASGCTTLWSLVWRRAGGLIPPLRRCLALYPTLLPPGRALWTSHAPPTDGPACRARFGHGRTFSRKRAFPATPARTATDAAETVGRATWSRQ